METLLAIINEPKDSKSFIVYVTHLAKDLHANVHLMYVQNPDNYILGAPEETGVASLHIHRKIESLAEAAKITFAKHIEDIRDEISSDVSIDYSTEVSVTSLIAEDFVRNNKASMVLLESQENKGFWSQPSANMDVIRHVHCPVWIIPYGYAYKTYKNIVYATDYKEEDISTIKRLIRLTRPFSPSITALHFTDSMDFEEKVRKTGFMEMLQKKTDYKNLSVKIQVEEAAEDIAEMIHGYAFKHTADLIVVLKGNRHFLDRILSADPTKKIIKEAQLPVLVYHEKE